MQTARDRVIGILLGNVIGVLAELVVVMLMVTVNHRLNADPDWHEASQTARQAAVAYEGVR